ncbi:P-II family nitrogen regulator [Gimibacter soli]|uniref:Nitrogen regulatory protein P-II n=1 Tax=Gimibacter soli TaxID=3024400 RepID=A0AAF0BJA8_9PROT|nr:P-II family nitrogen regulator [Gimibacter soli]WCL52904.1 P-II family nitrogen regulator [Gimibacter soli]
MKEIKAFIHRNRISDVVHELKQAGYKYISVVDVLGLLKALGSQEQQYSVDLGTKVVSEIKLELVCDDGQLDDAIDIISRQGRTGQKTGGWIYVTDVEQAIKIDGS